MAHQNRLNNSRVLVFGGTSGIGFAIASMALSNGSYVTIHGSSQAKVDSKISQLRSIYPHLQDDKVSGYALDLSNKTKLETNLTTFFENVTNGGANKLNHITFTAGDIPNVPQLKDVDVESALDGLTIRYLGPIFIAKLLTKGTYMDSSTSNSFTLTGGNLSKRPPPGMSVAAGWPAALEGLVRGLAVDLSPIRVNIVVPGLIETELRKRFIDAYGAEALEKLKSQNGILGTLGKPEDTAEAYGWLMRDHFVTGSRAGTDGGSLLAPPG